MTAPPLPSSSSSPLRVPGVVLIVQGRESHGGLCGLVCAASVILHWAVSILQPCKIDFTRRGAETSRWRRWYLNISSTTTAACNRCMELFPSLLTSVVFESSTYWRHLHFFCHVFSQSLTSYSQTLGNCSVAVQTECLHWDVLLPAQISCCPASARLLPPRRTRCACTTSACSETWSNSPTNGSLLCCCSVPERPPLFNLVPPLLTFTTLLYGLPLLHVRVY